MSVNLLWGGAWRPRPYGRFLGNSRALLLHSHASRGSVRPEASGTLDPLAWWSGRHVSPSFSVVGIPVASTSAPRKRTRIAGPSSEVAPYAIANPRSSLYPERTGR